MRGKRGGRGRELRGGGIEEKEAEEEAEEEEKEKEEQRPREERYA
jgi:hypothetical protein